MESLLMNILWFMQFVIICYAFLSFGDFYKMIIALFLTMMSVVLTIVWSSTPNIDDVNEGEAHFAIETTILETDTVKTYKILWNK